MSARKILLVDDSKSARYALRLLLKNHNLEVDTADSAEVALEKIQSELPDAIFMDHLMPGMNGFEALEALKKDPRTQHIPVVMCTSNDEEPYQRQAREKGALGILPKPADQAKLGEVLQAIEAAISEARQPSQGPAATTAPATAAAGVESATIAATMQEQTHQLMQNEIGPYIEKVLNDRMQGLETDVTERILASTNRRMEEWTASATDRVREASMQAGSEAAIKELNDRLDAEIARMRDELVKMETDHAHAVAHKISKEVVPGLVQTRMEGFEQQLSDKLDSRVEEILDRLVEDLSQHARFTRLVSEVAGSIAEQKAMEIATTHARSIAATSAEERAGEVTDFLMSSAKSANRRMYLLAGFAAALGMLSSALVYFMMS
jgi:CheY-like chemotaxis protein